MAMIQEGLYLGDLLKYEAPQLYSRERVTVAAGQVLKMGTVVAELPNGQVKALAPGANDSTKIAVGVLITDSDAHLMDRDALMVCRHAIVVDIALIWPAGVTAEQKAAAIAQLKALGVLIRTGA
jgi:hypothetical protein